MFCKLFSLGYCSLHLSNSVFMRFCANAQFAYFSLRFWFCSIIDGQPKLMGLKELLQVLNVPE